MKNILITHAFGPQNRGDHELLEKLIDLLRTRYGKAPSIHVLTTHPEGSAEMGLEGVTFEKSPFFRPSRFADWLWLVWDMPFWILASFLLPFTRLLSKSRRECLNHYFAADLIVMCPGGYVYSNGLSLYVNLVNGIPYFKSKARKIAAPMSVGPFFSRIDCFLSKIFLKNMDSIHVRESFSLKVVSDMGLSPIPTPDLAWWLDEAEVISVDTAWDGYFVGTVIDWNYPDCNFDINYKERYIKEILLAADVLFEKNAGKPLILYNQVGSGDGKSKDEILITEIVKRSKGKVIFDGSACSPLSLRKRLKGSKGVLASRFHSALFAIQVDVPFIAIAYQPKAEYILKDLGLVDSCRSIIDFSGEEIATELIALSTRSESFKARLVIAKKNTKEDIVANFLKVI